MKHRITVLALALAAAVPAYADVLSFCSATPASLINTQTPTGYTAKLASTSTFSVGACTTPPPPTSCPVIHSSTTGVANFTHWEGSRTVYYGVTPKSKDVASFDDLYNPYPGQYGLIVIYPLPSGPRASNYLGIKYTMPANYTTAPNVPVPLYGAYSGGETGNATRYSMTISTSCGDFSNPAIYPSSSVVSGCWRNLLQTKGLIQWNGNSSDKCVLHGGQTYFLNIINADISKVQPNGGGSAASTSNTGCSSTACSLPIMDGPGTWNGYVPN